MADYNIQKESTLHIDMVMRLRCPCDDIMKHWSPHAGVADLLDEVHTMLGHPDVDAPLCAQEDHQRREQYRHRPEEYEQMARQSPMHAELRSRGAGRWRGG